MKIHIYCKLNDSLYVALADVRENMGHDDSLPYQAKVLVSEKDTTPSNGNPLHFVYLLNAFNDGWGGNTEFRIATKDTETANRLIAKVKEACKQHTAYFNGKPMTQYDLRLLVDLMAENLLSLEEAEQQKTYLYKLDDDKEVLADENHYNLYLVNSGALIV